MTTELDPERMRVSEVAELRRELARVRERIVRQAQAHEELRQAVQEMRQQLGGRLDKLELIGAVTDYRLELESDAVDRLGADMKHQRRALDDCYQWTEAHLRDLRVWVEPLAARVWPKMGAFFNEIQRVFPKGWAVVPSDRLAKKFPPLC